MISAGAAAVVATTPAIKLHVICNGIPSGKIFFVFRKYFE
jgi:hypothetical protein